MRIIYFFDIISPYSALSWKLLRRYKQAWGYELILKPMFLGGVMQATTNQPPGLLKQRGKFQSADLARQASFLEVPLLPVPRNFFSEVARSCISVQRLVCAAQLEPGLGADDLADIVDVLTNKVHCDAGCRSAANELKIDESFLANALKCTAVGAEDAALAQRLLAAVNSDAAKALLKTNTTEAVDAGVFGSPTMLVDGIPDTDKAPMFIFGSDRFEQLAFVAKKKYSGPFPPSRL